MLTALERRDTPSAPAGLLDVPRLYVPTSGSTGYSEGHQITKSFSTTLTLDESGTGSAGSYTIDIVGSSNSQDTTTGSGGAVTSSTGTLTSDISFHRVIHGRRTTAGDVVDDQSYSESGSTTSSYSLAIGQSSSSTTAISSSETDSWTLAWTGTVTNGALSYTTYSGSETLQSNWHRSDSSDGFTTADQQLSTGSAFTLTASGSNVAYTGRNWSEEHRHMYSHSAPYDYPYDRTWDDPLSGGVQTAGLGSVPITWNAGEATATNYTWHGQTVSSGSLTETATFNDAGMDVNSFASTGHFSDRSHLVEDEPGVTESGTGTKSYHVDDDRTFTDDTTGSGSYADGHADANFHIIRAGNYNTLGNLQIEGDQTSGIDEDGNSFEIDYNHTSASTDSGSASLTLDFHHGDDGVVLLGVDYTRSDSTSTAFHTWGMQNGTGFSDTYSLAHSSGDTLSLPGEPGVDSASSLSQAYPFGRNSGNQFQASYRAEVPTPQLSPIKLADMPEVGDCSPFVAEPPLRVDRSEELTEILGGGATFAGEKFRDAISHDVLPPFLTWTEYLVIKSVAETTNEWLADLSPAQRVIAVDAARARLANVHVDWRSLRIPQAKYLEGGAVAGAFAVVGVEWAKVNVKLDDLVPKLGGVFVVRDKASKDINALFQAAAARGDVTTCMLIASKLKSALVQETDWEIVSRLNVLIGVFHSTAFMRYYTQARKP